MTEQRSNSSFLCILIPFLLGAFGFVALYWYAKDSKAEYIENDLNIKSVPLLKENQIGGAIINMDGRDATLTGTVASQERSQEIEQIISALPGIRTVNNHLEIAKAEVIQEELKVEALQKSEQKSEPQTEITLAPEPLTDTTAHVKVEIVEELLQTLNLSGITFHFSSDEITQQGKLILDDVISVLAEHPEFNVAIEGHTDSIGDDDVNLNLSQLRAQSVLNYLANAGIRTERLSATGYGASAPIASNDTAEGRAANRRIEFIVSRPQ
jgi:outer membrane protein OmpA-like peptidoglycan-associated protein